MLSLKWNHEEDTKIVVVAFKRGAWEDELLRMANAEPAATPPR